MVSPCIAHLRSVSFCCFYFRHVKSLRFTFSRSGPHLFLSSLSPQVHNLADIISINHNCIFASGLPALASFLLRELRDARQSIAELRGPTAAQNDLPVRVGREAIPAMAGREGEAFFSKDQCRTNKVRAAQEATRERAGAKAFPDRAVRNSGGGGISGWDTSHSQSVACLMPDEEWRDHVQLLMRANCGMDLCGAVEMMAGFVDSAEAGMQGGKGPGAGGDGAEEGPVDKAETGFVDRAEKGAQGYAGPGVGGNQVEAGVQAGKHSCAGPGEGGFVNRAGAGVHEWAGAGIGGGMAGFVSRTEAGFRGCEGPGMGGNRVEVGGNVVGGSGDNGGRSGDAGEVGREIGDGGRLGSESGITGTDANRAGHNSLAAAAATAAEDDVQVLAFEVAQVIRSLIRMLSDPDAIDAAGPYACLAASAAPAYNDAPVRCCRPNASFTDSGEGGGGSDVGGIGIGSGNAPLAGSAAPSSKDAMARCCRPGASPTGDGVAGAEWWEAAHALLSRARAVLQQAQHSALHGECVRAANGSSKARARLRQDMRSAPETGSCAGNEWASRRGSPPGGGAAHLTNGRASRRFWRRELRRMRLGSGRAAAATAHAAHERGGTQGGAVQLSKNI